MGAPISIEVPQQEIQGAIAVTVRQEGPLVLMPLPGIRDTVPVGAPGPYLDIVASPEVIQDITEVPEAVHMVVPELRPEGQVLTTVLEEAPAAINPQHVRHHEVVGIVDHVQVLQEAADIVDLDPVPPEAAVIARLPEVAQEAMAEVPGDQEALVEVPEEAIEVLEVGVHQVDVPQEEEVEEEGTNSKKSSNKKIR